jgi:hypothetical protein
VKRVMIICTCKRILKMPLWPITDHRVMPFGNM